MKLYFLQVESLYSICIYPFGPRDLTWCASSLAISSSITADDLPAPVKTRKNRWRVETRGAESVTIRYRLYCREMTVRTNWIDENFALLNGAASFLTLVDKTAREHVVRIELPSAWHTAISALPSDASHTFRAPDYDTLVDSPILAGNPAVHEFQVNAISHFLVNQGETPLWAADRSVKDVQTIVQQNLKMWGSLPYDKYVFLNLITDSGGGLEHKNSLTIMSSRYVTRTRKTYLAWLGIVSHEYFHAWNVKRLRPVELGPFDYENEVYTRSLWIAEGFTEYYSALNVRRAGLATDAEYLGAGATPADMWSASLSSLVDALQTTPGRLTQPVDQASYDSWIKLYRPDENSANSGISYYVKGAIIGWLLDARIRHATAGGKSLDDVMRAAYARYSGERGYSPEEFVQIAGEVAGQDLSQWFHQALSTTEELDYKEALDWFGLEWKATAPPKNGGRPKAWTGFQTRNEGRLTIRTVTRDTPAFSAGLSAEDEILAVDGFRVAPDQWSARLEQYAPGDTIELLLSRRDRIIRVPLRLGEEPPRRWQLQLSATASAAQKAHFAAWVNGATSAPVQPQP